MLVECPLLNFFVTIDALAMKQPTFSVAITFAYGTWRDRKDERQIERRRQRRRPRHAAARRSALFSASNLLYALHHAAVDARISPRRNNRSFNSDAGSLSLSPVKRRPARFRHRSRRTFILLLVSRGARFIIAEAMICKISPPRSLDFRQASRAQAVTTFIKCTN